MVMHEQHSLTLEETTQAGDLWFDDGNIILQAEKTLFRVYSGFLGARSSVFRDMLSFPPPAEGNDKLDGCPIVVLYDSARDVNYFLKAIFDSSFFEPPPTQTMLPIVEGILRLSRKYDVQYLKRRALAHLDSAFPMTLAAWKMREKTRTIPPIDNTPFAAFKVAREFELDWLMPSIAYCISSHPFEKTLDYAIFDDERIDLEWPDKRMCIVGRQKLIMMQAQIALQMTRTADAQVEGCTNPTCTSTRLRCADILSGWDMASFLDYFEDNASLYSHEFCPVCLTAFKDSCVSSCEKLWNDLPGFFHLPSWEDLEKNRCFVSD